MPIITLLTDFGVEDEYVGIMKGVILSVNPSVSIVDITHHIEPQNLIRAAYVIRASYRYFPKGTIHVVVVDPGVGSGRAILALEIKGHCFIAPDNGVLTLLMEEEIDSIVSIENPDYFLDPVSRTFHGRDVFAPVAGHISKGVGIKNLGRSLEKGDIIRLRIRRPWISEKGELVGAVVSIDRFGNLVTNIDSHSLERFCRAHAGKKPRILVGQGEIHEISQSYSEAGFQTPLAVIGSRGYLEIAVNCGSARDHFTVAAGDAVRVVASD